MFNVGFTELLLVAAAAVIFLRPKDLPVILRQVSKFMREIRALTAEVKGHANAVMADSGVNEMRTIIDLEGKEQQAYDVAELEDLKKK